MESLIKVTGTKGLNKGKGNKFGRMEVSMLENGKIIKLMAMVHSTTLMEMSMKDNGPMTKQTVKAHILILMELNTSVNGKMTNNMDMELNSG